VSRRGQDGLAAPAVVTLAALLCFLTLLVLTGGRVIVEHRRVAAAADLTALAAATALQHGEPGCAAAHRFARLNGAVLDTCAVRGDVVDVTVAVSAVLVVGGRVTLRAEARAGPNGDADGGPAEVLGLR